MNDWQLDLYFNCIICAIMKFPRGQPPPDVLAIFRDDYHKHELAKCLAQKNNAVDAAQ